MLLVLMLLLSLNCFRGVLWMPRVAAGAPQACASPEERITAHTPPRVTTASWRPPLPPHACKTSTSTTREKEIDGKECGVGSNPLPQQRSEQQHNEKLGRNPSTTNNFTAQRRASHIHVTVHVRANPNPNSDQIDMPQYKKGDGKGVKNTIKQHNSRTDQG